MPPLTWHAPAGPVQRSAGRAGLPRPIRRSHRGFVAAVSTMPMRTHGVGGDTTEISRPRSNNHRLIMIGRLAFRTCNSMGLARQCRGEVLLDCTVIVGSRPDKRDRRPFLASLKPTMACLAAIPSSPILSRARLSALLPGNLGDSIPITRTCRVAA